MRICIVCTLVHNLEELESPPGRPVACALDSVPAVTQASKNARPPPVGSPARPAMSVPPRTPAPTATRIETLTREVNAARAEAIRSRGFEEEMEDKLPLATGSTLVACGTHVQYASHAHFVSQAAQRAA